MAAVLMGHIAVSKIQLSVQPRSGTGLAIGGFVTGYFATVVGTFLFIVTIIIGVASSNS